MNIQRAKHLVTLQEEQRRPLWYLLLAWELADSEQLQEAQVLLDYLLSNTLPLLHGWAAEMAACLMDGISVFDFPSFDIFQYRRIFNKLLGRKGYLRTFKYALAVGNLPLAVVELWRARDRKQMTDLLYEAMIFWIDRVNVFVEALEMSKKRAWKKWEEKNEET